MKINQKYSRIRFVAHLHTNKYLDVYKKLADSHPDKKEEPKFEHSWLSDQGRGLLEIDGERGKGQVRVEEYHTDFGSRYKKLKFVFDEKQPSHTKINEGKICGGITLTATPIILFWIDISIDSEDPAQWLRLIQKSRIIGNEKRTDHNIFFNGDNADFAKDKQFGITALLRELAEHFGLGEYGSKLSGAVYRYEFFTIASADAEETAHFEESIRTGANVTGTQMELPEKNADRSLAGMACFSRVMNVDLQNQAELNRAGSSFAKHFWVTDFWLSFAMLLGLHQLLNYLEGYLVDLPYSRKKGVLSEFRAIRKLQRNFDDIMDEVIMGFWRTSINQLHLEERRHSDYQLLKEKWQTEADLDKMERDLGQIKNFLDHKQNKIIQFILAVLTIGSLLLATLGINIKGYTAHEGMSLLVLLVILLAFFLFSWLFFRPRQ